jgi:hypothetical protein
MVTKIIALLAVLFGLAVGSAVAAPINVCILNPHNYTLWVSLRFPGGGISNFSLPAGQTERRQGDSTGSECSDSQPFANNVCPNPKSQMFFAC